MKHRLYYSTRLLCTKLNVLLREATDYIGAQQMKYAHSFKYILFVSGGLGMCDRLTPWRWAEIGDF